MVHEFIQSVSSIETNESRTYWPIKCESFNQSDSRPFCRQLPLPCRSNFEPAAAVPYAKNLAVETSIGSPYHTGFFLSMTTLTNYFIDTSKSFFCNPSTISSLETTNTQQKRNPSVIILFSGSYDSSVKYIESYFNPTSLKEARSLKNSSKNISWRLCKDNEAQTSPGQFPSVVLIHDGNSRRNRYTQLQNIF